MSSYKYQVYKIFFKYIAMSHMNWDINRQVLIKSGKWMIGTLKGVFVRKGKSELIERFADVYIDEELNIVVCTTSMSGSLDKDVGLNHFNLQLNFMNYNICRIIGDFIIHEFGASPANEILSSKTDKKIPYHSWFDHLIQNISLDECENYVSSYMFDDRFSWSVYYDSSRFTPSTKEWLDVIIGELGVHETYADKILSITDFHIPEDVFNDIKETYFFNTYSDERINHFKNFVPSISSGKIDSFFNPIAVETVKISTSRRTDFIEVGEFFCNYLKALVSEDGEYTLTRAYNKRMIADIEREKKKAEAARLYRERIRRENMERERGFVYVSSDEAIAANHNRKIHTDGTKDSNNYILKRFCEFSKGRPNKKVDLKYISNWDLEETHFDLFGNDRIKFILVNIYIKESYDIDDILSKDFDKLDAFSRSKFSSDTKSYKFNPSNIHRYGKHAITLIYELDILEAMVKDIKACIRRNKKRDIV